MLNTQDYLFNYKHLFRFFFLHKFCLLNNGFEIPIINKFVGFFSIKNFNNMDDSRIYNYYYFFRFFFGHRAVFTGYKSFFNLGLTSYSFKIQMNLFNKDIYNALLFLSNDLLPFLPKQYLYVRSYFLKSFVALFVVTDLNIFTERKTSLGLFNLKNPLNLEVSINSTNGKIFNLVLQSFKIYI